MLTIAPLLAARGRSIARLIENLWNGDPVAWAILGVVVALFAGWYILKAVMGWNEEYED